MRGIIRIRVLRNSNDNHRILPSTAKCMSKAYSLIRLPFDVRLIIIHCYNYIEQTVISRSLFSFVYIYVYIE